MKVLGENFIAKIKAWMTGREVWTSGTGEGSVITVVCKKSLDDDNHGAIGSCSYAGGYNTTANGDYSHAEGYSTTASGSFSHAEGIYNVDDPKALHVVGVGNSSSSHKNAEVIYYYSAGDAKNGYKYIIGVGGYDGTTAVDVSKHKSVQEVIADLTARIEKLEKG